MKNIGCIMRLFVAGFLLFQANCVNSAEPTKIQVGEKVNVDFLHHKNLKLKNDEFEIYNIYIRKYFLAKDTFTCYLTYPLSDQVHKKNEFKWSGSILAIPKKNPNMGDFFLRNLIFLP